MSEKLNTFIHKLAEDASLLKKFEQDPEQAIAETSLPEDAKQALLSRDPGRIREVVTREMGGTPGRVNPDSITVVVVTWVRPPNRD
jgi:hypothetical protein